jgi:diguanylate cyclase (GGDEF)-like protein/PAS domain S-box-containing protein
VHLALMPDYNRKATVYWWAVVLLGTVTLLHSGRELAAMPLWTVVQIAAGMAIAMLAGFFPVRIPHSKNSFAAGEIFIFLLLLLHGPAAATMAAAGEALVGSWRTSKRWTSRIASPAMAALAMMIAGTLLQALMGALDRMKFNDEGLVVLAAMVFALGYFTLNTLLVSALPRLKRNERLELSVTMGLFGWVGIAFAGSAAVAALLYLTFKQSGIGVLMAVVPIVGMLLATLHYYFRQQEAQETVRVATSQAAEREAAVAARHLRELEASERRFHSAFTHASIGMALLSVEGRILQANAALRSLLGQDDAGLVQHRLQEFVIDEHLAPLQEQLASIDQAGVDGFEIELRCRRSDDRVVWVAANCSYFSEPGSTAPCLILQAQDISARREAEAGLHHIAFHDSLTGLPNRRRFRDLLAQAVERAQSDADHRYAVMFLDFDRFKLINDSLGHAAGDRFLVQVSRRIATSVRPNDIVARLGGDEFAVLVQGLAEEADVITLADRLLLALRHPYMVDGTELNSSASIGITFSSFGYTAPEDVLRDADIAMYRAKAAGKARYALFDVSLHAEVAHRVGLESDLRRAIADGQMAVAYQPLFNLDTRQLVGFEALARWTHPEHGVIGPDVFIPIAEDSGLVVQITDTLLHQACHRLKTWQRRHPDFAGLTMHVNISSKDIGQMGFMVRVMHALAESGLQAQHLTLELTENILMERLETALPLLLELRALGIGLSVDDFGTGYSSLAHLSTLPIDSLKVDRSFVRNLRTGSKESAIVRAIVHMGDSLGKRVIAEGIETQSQYGQLREMGCLLGQGFHMSRPLLPEAVDALLERWLADAPEAQASTA